MEFIHFLRVFIFNKKNHNKQGDRTNSISGAPPWCYVIGFFYLLEKKKIFRFQRADLSVVYNLMEFIHFLRERKNGWRWDITWRVTRSLWYHLNCAKGGKLLA
jgi:hypothetical protein